MSASFAQVKMLTFGIAVLFVITGFFFLKGLMRKHEPNGYTRKLSAGFHLPSLLTVSWPKLSSGNGIKQFTDSAINDVVTHGVTAVRARTIKPASEGGGDPDPDTQAERGNYYGLAEARLDQAFTRFERGRISLETYRQIVQGVRQEAWQIVKRAEFGVAPGRLDSGLQIVLDDVKRALEAADWCLEWADTQSEPPPSQAEAIPAIDAA